MPPQLVKLIYMQSLSVIIRTKNRPLLLQRAMLSISKQHTKPQEIIVVNDGGDTEPLAHLLRDADTNTLKLINHKTSLGRANALNEGIKAARCQYIAIHDDDDTWAPDFLSALFHGISAWKHSGIQFIGALGSLVRIEEEIVGNDIKTIKKYKPIIENSSKGVINILKYLALEEDFYPIQAIFLKSAAEQVGLFDPKFEMLEDRHFFIRMLKLADFCKVDNALAYHHIRRKSVGNSYSNTFVEFNKVTAYHTLLDNDLLRGDKQSFFNLSPIAKEMLITKQYARRAAEKKSKIKKIKTFLGINKVEK